VTSATLPEVTSAISHSDRGSDSRQYDWRRLLEHPRIEWWHLIRICPRLLCNDLRWLHMRPRRGYLALSNLFYLSLPGCVFRSHTCWSPIPNELQTSPQFSSDLNSIPITIWHVLILFLFIFVFSSLFNFF